jgi:hypothetical protein
MIKHNSEVADELPEQVRDEIPYLFRMIGYERRKLRNLYLFIKKRTNVKDQKLH